MSTRSPLAVADLPFERSAIVRSTRDLLAAEPIARIRKVDASRVVTSGLGVADDTLRALLDRAPVRRRRSRRRPIALGVGLLVGMLSLVWVAASRTRRSAAAAVRHDEVTAPADDVRTVERDGGQRIAAEIDPSVREAIGSQGAIAGSGSIGVPSDAASPSPLAPTDEAAVRRTRIEIGVAPRD